MDNIKIEFENNVWGCGLDSLCGGKVQRMTLVNRVRINMFLCLIKQRALNTYEGTAPRIP